MTEKYFLTIDVVAEEKAESIKEIYKRENHLIWDLATGRFTLPSIEEVKEGLKKMRTGHTSLEMEIINMEFKNPSECVISVSYERYKEEDEKMAEKRVHETFAKLYYPFVEWPLIRTERSDESRYDDFMFW